MYGVLFPYRPRVLLAGAGMLALFSSVFSLPSTLAEEPAAGAAAGDGRAAAAGALVRSALRAELAGRNELRQASLEQALEVDPDFAPARWQSGELRLGGKWMPVKDAQRAAVEDKLLKEYREKRAATPNEVRAQERLAHWCEAHNLPVESRVHWNNVLRLDPQNRRALGELDLEYYQGELLTKDEIERRNEEAKQHKRDIQQWQPTILEIRRGLASEDFKQRNQARDRLHAIDDPTAIGALEKYLSGESLDAAMEVVETLGAMKNHEATLSLIQHAAYSQWLGVREAAAKQLAQRPMQDYVPLLLDQLVPPVDAGFRINMFPGGCSYVQVYSQDGPFSRHVLVDIQAKTLTVMTMYFKRGFGVSESTVRPGGVDPSPFATAALANKLDVMSVNRELKSHNERFFFVLREATKNDQGNTPMKWWNWWQRYNEIHMPQDKPVFFQVQGRQLNYGLVNFRPSSTSCFLAGTKVWTQTGLVPIETIQLGDQVLAQDPDTGELAFKPVLATTLRPPAEMLEMTFAGESIKTTRGHPFWLDGTGWRMAKLLEPGGIVHALRGGVTLDSVTPAPKAEAHNLVVADFHNYFVGETGLLVHDNTPRTPTEAVVPGLLEAN